MAEKDYMSLFHPEHTWALVCCSKVNIGRSQCATSSLIGLPYGCLVEPSSDGRQLVQVDRYALGCAKQGPMSVSGVSGCFQPAKLSCSACQQVTISCRTGQISSIELAVQGCNNSLDAPAASGRSQWQTPAH